MTTNEFKFRKNDDIGAADADDDIDFLADCFVNTGDFDTAIDCNSSKRIIVGRTGSGKTAIIKKIYDECERVIKISPETLSLNYIANNEVFKFFEKSGVNLAPFYILLWKHIFVVELLKYKYNINNKDSQKKCLRKLRDLIIKDEIKELAIDYLEKWGKKFWLTSDVRMKELTQIVQNELTASLEAKLPHVKASAQYLEGLSEQERTEIVEIGQKAVSEVQVRELINLIYILNDHVFTDKQKQYYIVIDTLDDEWADDRIKYKLIKSLIDSIRSFRRIYNIKIVIGLRKDLIEKVITSTSESGFQEEKYESFYLHLKWNRKQLAKLLELRINKLIKRRYTKDSVKLEDMLPNQIGKVNPIDYILDRTFLRPRDAILFLNECISNADGKPTLTAEIIKQSEEEYSQKRLQSLEYEWRGIYPEIRRTCQILNGLHSRFKLSEITQDILNTRFLEVVDRITPDNLDPVVKLLDKLYTESGNFNTIRSYLFRFFYTVGLVGIKKGPTSSVLWSYTTRSFLNAGELKPTHTIYIHPSFHRALGTKI